MASESKLTAALDMQPKTKNRHEPSSRDASAAKLSAIDMVQPSTGGGPVQLPSSTFARLLYCG